MEDIVDTIIFWAQKPSIRQIEFRWKLTEHVYNELKRVGKYHAALEALYKSNAARASGHQNSSI
jgi:hypothetical protein